LVFVVVLYILTSTSSVYNMLFFDESNKLANALQKERGDVERPMVMHLCKHLDSYDAGIVSTKSVFNKIKRLKYAIVRNKYDRIFF